MIEVELPDGTIVEVETDDPAAAAAAAHKFQQKAAQPPMVPGGTVVPEQAPAAPKTDYGNMGGYGPMGMSDPNRVLERVKPIDKSSLAAAGQGLGAAAADIVGMVPDTISMMYNLPAATLNAISESHGGPAGIPMIPSMSNRVSDIVGETASKLGYPVRDPKDMPYGDDLLYSALRYGTGAGVVGGALSKASQARQAQYGERLTRTPMAFDPMLSPYEKKPAVAIAQDVAAGTGSGVASAALDQADVDENGFMRGGAMMGGAAGGLTLARALASPASIPAAFRGGRAAVDLPYISVGEQTVPVTNRQADEAAKIFQSNLSDPKKFAGEVATGRADYEASGLPVPPPGTLSNDIGAILMENAARTKEARPFAENDAALREAAGLQVRSLQEPGAVPRAATEFADRDAAQRRGTVARDVAETEATVAKDVQSKVDESLAEVAAAQATIQRQTEAVYAENAAKIAKAKEADAAARASEQATAAAYREPGDAGAASRELDKTVVDETLKPRQAEKNAKFAAIPDSERDIAPLQKAVDDVRATLGKLNNPAAVVPEETLRRIEALAPQTRTTDRGPATFKIDEATGESVQTAGGKIETQAKGTVSFQDMNKLRPELASAINAARKAGNFALADNLKRLKRSIGDEADRMAAEGNPQAKEAQAYFKEEFAPYFGEGTRGGQLRADINADTNRVNTAPSSTAERFLNTGSDSKEAAADLQKILSIAPNPEAGQAAARNYIIADLAKTVDAKTLTINPTRLRDWLNKRRGMLSEFPAVEAETQRLLQDVVNKRDKTNATARELKKLMEEATSTQRIAEREAKVAESQAKTKSALDIAAAKEDAKARLDAAKLNQQLTERDIQNGNLSLLLDSSPDVAVARVFGADDRVKAMDGVVKTLGKDKTASVGWKRAVADYMVDTVTGSKADRPGGQDAVGYAKAKKFFDDNRETLAKVFSPEEMNALQKAQKAIEPLAKQQFSGTIGSQTAERSAKMWGMFEAGMKAYFGILKGGGITRTARLYSKLINDDSQAIQVLLAKATLDPDVAIHLAERNVTDKTLPKWNSRLSLLLTGQELDRRAAEEDEPASEDPKPEVKK